MSSVAATRPMAFEIGQRTAFSSATLAHENLLYISITPRASAIVFVEMATRTRPNVMGARREDPGTKPSSGDRTRARIVRPSDRCAYLARERWEWVIIAISAATETAHCQRFMHVKALEPAVWLAKKMHGAHPLRAKQTFPSSSDCKNLGCLLKAGKD